ncbi:MAG: hypothetical protein ACNA7W_06810 [Pseudomonadales bacterium]
MTTLSDDGLGEGCFESRAVKARNALPGEAVTVWVRKRRGGVWYGEAEQPQVPAMQRQAAPCGVFPRCGGCALQHLQYPLQLAHKAARLQAALAEHGVVPGRVRRPVSPTQLHYRYKARLGVRVVGDEVLVGFREGFSNRIVRMTECKTLALPFVRMLPWLKQALGRLREPDRVPQIELAGGDRDFAIVVRHLGDLDAQDHGVLDDFARTTGMRVYLQPAGYDSVRRHDQAESPYLSYTNPDYGLCYQFLPTDFTQVNPFANRALVRAALLGLAASPGATATDMFCGIGNFSLALARSGLRVRGYESAAGAVERAQMNARSNGLSARAEFAVADLYHARCAELPETEYLLLDPPRSGAGANLQRWASWRTLQRIAYVSCNPRTFAADAALLQSCGFRLEEVGIFDMFPHTAHVETLGVFARRQEADTGG